MELGEAYWEAVVVALKDVLIALEKGDVDLAGDVVHRKGMIYQMANDTIHALGEQLRNDSIDLEQFRISTDVVGQIKRIYYNIRKIAQIIIKQSSAQQGIDSSSAAKKSVPGVDADESLAGEG